MVSWQMKHNKIFYILTLVFIVCLLMVVVPATPAMAVPVITLSPSTGAIGTQMTVTGSNFNSYCGDRIYIFLNDLEIDSNPLTIPESGSFSVTFYVPDDATPDIAWVTVRIISRALVSQDEVPERAWLNRRGISEEVSLNGVSRG